MKKEVKFYYVYIITNLILNKQYIGSRKCYKNKIEDDIYWGSSGYLKRDFKIYGKENFKKEIINYKYTNVKDMLDGETKYILQYNTLEPNGYNRFLPNKHMGFYAGFTNHTHAVESKLKTSIKLRGRKVWNDGKIGKCPQLATMKNKHHSDESKEKIRSATSKENNPFWGKHHSEESKIKMQKSGKIRDNSSYRTEEHRNKKRQMSSGERNGMYGKSFYDIWIEKYGKEKADEKLEKYKENKRKNVI
jgi:group I intron endonuclease